MNVVRNTNINDIIMFTSGDQKQTEFYRELKELLAKYDAEISIDESTRTHIIVEFGPDASLLESTGSGWVPTLSLGSWGFGG
jgi:hypothetical protein